MAARALMLHALLLCGVACLATLVPPGGDDIAVNAVCSKASTGDAASPCTRRDMLLLQMRTRREKSPDWSAALAAVDAQVAQRLRAKASTPKAIGAVVTQGVAAVSAALPHFMADPPRLGEGISALGAGLFESIAGIVRGEFQGDAFEQFRRSWMEMFEELPTELASIEEELRAFHDTGLPVRLIQAVATILTAVSDGAMRFLPPNTATEVGKYLDAVEEVFETIGTSWEDFQKGRIGSGIEVVYFGLRNATRPLIPVELRNDTTYKAIVGTLDNIIGDLSETVMDYKRQIVEGSVCWKGTQRRERQRPQVCPGGYFWNGEQFCFPAKAAALLATGGAAGEAAAAGEGAEKLETALARKRGVDGSAGGKVPNGAVPARCAEGSGFPEKHHHWCYAACPEGFVARGKECRSACSGDFGVDDGSLMCGKSQGALLQAVLQMIFTTVNTAIAAATQIAKMREHGVDADSLTAVVKSFVDCGKPFAYATCGAERSASVAPPAQEMPLGMAMASDAAPPAQDAGCHTAVDGEGCHGDVAWAMETGIRQRPDWYPGLNRSSSFEAFQRHLHLHGGGHGNCPMPC